MVVLPRPLRYLLPFHCCLTSTLRLSGSINYSNIYTDALPFNALVGIICLSALFVIIIFLSPFFFFFFFFSRLKSISLLELLHCISKSSTTVYSSIPKASTTAMKISTTLSLLDLTPPIQPRALALNALDSCKARRREVHLFCLLHRRILLWQNGRAGPAERLQRAHAGRRESGAVSRLLCRAAERPAWRPVRLPQACDLVRANARSQFWCGQAELVLFDDGE